MAESRLEIKCTKFDYSGTNIIYRGQHHNLNPDDDDDDWILTQYTYVVDDVTLQKKKEGSWTNRTDGWT
jgi:hypothetical protein